MGGNKEKYTVLLKQKQTASDQFVIDILMSQWVNNGGI